MSFKRSVKKAHCRRSRASGSVAVAQLRLGRLRRCGLGTERFLTDLFRWFFMLSNDVKKAHCRRSRASGFINIFTATILLISINGCNLNLGEKPPVTKVGQFAGGKCLTQATPTIKKFLEGEASQAEVANTWDCITDAMTKFRKYVRGKVSDRYSSQEFSTFLENNFLDEGSRIQPSLQVEFMKIKQIFIGGGIDSITLKEIDRSLSVFQTFKNISLRINPYMKILTLNWQPEYHNENNNELIFFEEANEVVQQTSFELSSLIQVNHLGYHLDDFVVLLDQLAHFNHEEWESVRKIERFMPVVKKVKKAVAGGDEQNVMPGEWRSFVSLGVRGYVQYLRYYYFIRSAPQTGMAIKLSYIAKSIEDALSIFQDLVAAKPTGIVSKEEVSEILFTFSEVWPEFKVSELLIEEFMKIKQLIFGGSLNEWNRDDFALARLKIVKLKSIVERFLPYYAIYGKDWDRYGLELDEQRAIFKESQQSLESSAQEFGVLLETSYDLKSLVILTGELERLYDKTESYQLTNELKNYLPIIVDFKKQIYLDDGSFVSREKWPHFLNLVARSYSAYLYHYFFIKEQPWSEEHTFVDLKFLTDQIQQLFSFVLNSKEGNPWFSLTEIQSIAHRLIDADVIDKKVKYESIDAMTTAIFKHILIDPSLRGKKLPQLDRDTIQLLQQEALNYFDAEIFFIHTLSGHTAIANDDFVNAIQKELKNSQMPIRLKNLFLEFQAIAQSNYPFAVDEKLRLQIGKDKNPDQSLKSLDQLNFNRIIARLFLRGFASDLDKGLTLDEGIYAYSLLKPYYVDIDVLDKDNDAFPTSRFRDGNMFTPRANGDKYLSFLEGVDLVGLIWSGIKVSSDLKTDLFGQCVPVGSEIGSSTKISVPCVQKVFSKSMQFKMNSMPGFVQYMKVAQNSNNAYDWNFYLTNIFKSAGYIPNRHQMANYGDIGIVPHLIQYVELLYSKYDKNYDGFLSAAEAVKAYPCFSGIIRDMAKDELNNGSLEEKHLLPLFTFILRYGKPPETFKEKLRFRFIWRDHPEKWDVWADRTQIAKILGYIADQTAKADKK